MFKLCACRLTINLFVLWVNKSKEDGALRYPVIKNAGITSGQSDIRGA